MVDHSQKRESHGAMYRIGKHLRISYKDGGMHIIVEKNRNYLKQTVNQNQGLFSSVSDLRVVHTQSILFLKSMSDRSGSDKERP